MRWLRAALAAAALMALLGAVGCSSGGENLPAANPGAQVDTAGQPTAGASAPDAGQPQGNQPGRGISGTVKSVSAKVIQLVQDDGTAVTINVGDDTAIQKNESAKIEDIQKGLSVLVAGKESNGSWAASRIQIMAAGAGPNGGEPGAGQSGPGGTPGAGQPGPGGTPGAGQSGPGGSPQAGQSGPNGGGPGAMGGAGVMGQVQSVSGKTIQLTSRDSQVTVTLDDSTSIVKVAKGALSDIAAGTKITVVGQSSNGALTARMITID